MNTAEKVKKTKHKPGRKEKTTVNWDGGLVADLEELMRIDNRNSLSNYTETVLLDHVRQKREDGVIK